MLSIAPQRVESVQGEPSRAFPSGHEQRRALIAEQLKETPEQSNRMIAEFFKVDDKTVGAVRERMEESAEIPHFPQRQDPRTGKLSQPATKPKPPERRADTPPLAEFISIEWALWTWNPVTGCFRTGKSSWSLRAWVSTG